MRVMPPTRSTSLMSDVATPASLRQSLQGCLVRASRSDTNASNRARVITMLKCLAPDWHPRHSFISADNLRAGCNAAFLMLLCCHHCHRLYPIVLQHTEYASVCQQKQPLEILYRL